MFSIIAGAVASPALGTTPQPPPDWRMELVAQAPDIRHPSVVCAAPDGRVFVAEDPMDISTPHADAQEGRILCFNPDGRHTVFAEKLHAVFGMQFLEGRLYVLHNPNFSVFTDDNGVGRNRAELIESMNPNPWALDWNDHVPANFKLAMDGYFYIAVGDKGVYGAVGRDGKRVDMRGGILRMRPDGTGLEAYCTGTRNILDVALTDEDEMFTYDNTDENHWMGRVSHMVDGGFYGYPFDFIPQRPYTLWMLADYGAGAATGTLACNDDSLPNEYRGNLFLADFGQRNIRRVRVAREGGTFKAVANEQLFRNPPADFRPVGITFSDDGLSLFICDWQHRDTKENIVVGRLWKLAWAGTNYAQPRPSWYVPAAMGKTIQARTDDLLAALSHPARSVRLVAQRMLIARGREALAPLAGLLDSTNSLTRARVHAIWALDQIDGGKSTRAAIIKAASGSDPVLARQAIRQLGNSRAAEAVPALTQLLSHNDLSLRFQAATALGRIGDPAAVPQLTRALTETDLFTRYAVFHALNRIGCASPQAWPKIVEGFASGDARVREGTAFAVRETYDIQLVDALLTAFRKSPQESPTRVNLAVLETLAALHHMPQEWNGEWWAYHPFRLSPPARTNAWAGTAPVLSALSEALQDPNPTIRGASAEGLQQVQDTKAGALLLAHFDDEKDPGVKRAILHALASLKYPAAAPLAARLIKDDSSRQESASEVMMLAKATGGPAVVDALQSVIRSSSDTGYVRQAIEALGEIGAKDAAPLLQTTARSGPVQTRLAAIAVLSRLNTNDAGETLLTLLDDSAPEIRGAALHALAQMKLAAAVPALLRAWQSPELKVKAASALAQTPDVRAIDVYLDGLSSRQSALRSACRKALGRIRDDALPLLAPRFKALPLDVVGELQQIYRGHAGAAAAGLFAIEAKRPDREAYLAFSLANAGDENRGEQLFHDRSGVACINCHRVKGEGMDIGPDLSGIGAQFDRRALAESILWPSRVVREGYNVVEVVLNDGDEVSGMIRGETSESLSLQPAVGEPRSIPKAKIKARRPTELSLMPEGLEAGLSLEGFADLLSYLESLRSGS
jgi:putative membrane-bound dehydrogenase-like protein